MYTIDRYIMPISVVWAFKFEELIIAYIIVLSMTVLTVYPMLALNVLISKEYNKRMSM